jgi:DNA-binding transcriptional regulator PaaX
MLTQMLYETLLEQMETTLAHLAMHWRGSDSDEEADAIAHNYQVILRCMIDLGFRQSLQVDTELPDELMPQAYFDLFK